MHEAMSLYIIIHHRGLSCFPQSNWLRCVLSFARNTRYSRLYSWKDEVEMREWCSGKEERRYYIGDAEVSEK
jgi:hypothetical protein